jgi:hypothetical protein
VLAGYNKSFTGTEPKADVPQILEERSMRYLFITSLSALFCTFPLLGQAPQLTFTAKVVESKLVFPCVQTGASVSCNRELQLKAVIDDKTYWLEGKYTKDGLLKLGSYRAELSKDVHSANQRLQRSYRLKFTNGTSEEFTVVGLAE